MLTMLSKIFLLLFSKLAWTSSFLSLPTIHYDLLDSEIWTCHHSWEERIQSLEDALRVHILFRNKSAITFVASDSEILRELDTNCILSRRKSNFDTDYQEIKSSNRKKRSIGEEWFESYVRDKWHEHNLSTIYEWFKQLSNSHPQMVETFSIGYSNNNREILAVKLTAPSDKTLTALEQKPKVYLQCLLHAREWITGPMCMYIASRLVTEDETLNTQETYNGILTYVDVVMVPVANPDGYELTWMSYPKYRLWRKNLSRNSRDDKGCLGVDLNRNFNIEWGVHGSSGDHCSETYKGPSAESEEETKAIAELLRQMKPLIGALDFHSYSQAILYPSGWTTSPPENVEKIKKIAQKMANTASQHGTKYSSQQMGSIYLASGTFSDWVNSDEIMNSNKDIKGVTQHPLPLTIELQPLDDEEVNIGFMVHPNKILPSCKEMFDAVVKYISLMLENKDMLTA